MFINRVYGYFKYILNKMSGCSSIKPIVVILGATGTGKSKLSLEIATRFNGEIISADSMQIYKGLDVITNKVTPQERALVPHYMLDFLSPLENYNVVDFRDAALPIIEKLHKEQKLPVIVGGTHYYVESLLWNVLIQSQSKDEVKANSVNCVNRLKYLCELIKKLKFCDKKSGHEAQSDVNQLSDNSVLKEVSSINKDEINKFVSDNLVEFSDQNICACGSEVHTCDENVVASNLESCKMLAELSNVELLLLLEVLDPITASKYHPNDRRKVLRSLEVWVQTGVRHSDHLRRQSEDVGGADLGGRVRFENSALLWVTCDQDVLDKRLDDRVDAMIDLGLLKEMKDFHEAYNAPLMEELSSKDQTHDGAKEDCESVVRRHYERGIFQSIGYKEFHEYLLLSEEGKMSPKGQKLYRSSVELMKMRTKRYSRNQLKWIKKRFCLRDRMRIPVYTVDGTDPSKWDERVTPIANEVVTSIISGKTPESKPFTVELDEKHVIGDKLRYVCETCNRIIIGQIQWEAHINGARHRITLHRKRKNEESQNQNKCHKRQDLK